MGTISFQLPQNASPAHREDLAGACIAGGYDNMPAPTQVHVENDRIRLIREVDESGYLIVPWEVNGAGGDGFNGDLVERATPYRLGIEWRGKVNQLRNQAADWRMVGLQIPDSLETQIRDASHMFGRAVTGAGDSADDVAPAALAPATMRRTNWCASMSIRSFAPATADNRLDTTLGVRHQRRAPAGPPIASRTRL